jgi:hypothetical protein
MKKIYYFLNVYKYIFLLYSKLSENHDGLVCFLIILYEHF